MTQASHQTITRLLNGIALALVLVSLAGGVLVYRLVGDIGQEAVSGTQAYIDLDREEYDAEIAFHRQVQEWKDLLLRGNEPQAFEKYYSAFQSHHDEVQLHLQQLSAKMGQSGMPTAQVVLIRQAHRALRDRYEDALSRFPLAKNPDNYQRADTLVRGADRQLEVDLEALRHSVMQQVIARTGTVNDSVQDQHTLERGFVLVFMLLLLPTACLVALEAASRATRRIQDERERFGVTLNSIGDAVVVTDMSGAVEYLNPVGEAMTGWRLDEARGKPLREIFNIVNADTREPADNPVDAVLREGHTVGLATHTMLLSRSGQEYAIEDSAAPLRDANGKLGGVVLVFHDDTRQREVQHRLQESEERLRMTLKYAADAVFICERDGRFEFVNDNMSALLGYSSAELVQMTAFDLVPADWRAIYRQGSEQILVDNQNYLFEIRWLKKDGSKIPMELSAVLLPNGRIYGSCRDISERKNNQRQTETLVRRHQVMMKSTFDGIHILDMQGKLIEANDAFCKMLGYSQEEAAQLNVADWDAQWSREELLKRLTELVYLPGMLFETRHRCKDGKLIDVEVSTAGVEIDGQRYLFASSRDITARKQAEILQRQKFEEQEAIYLLSEAVSNADTLELVYEEAMDYVLRLIKIARVSIMLFDAQGVMRFKAWRGLSDIYRAALDGHSPWTRDVVDPRPFCVDKLALDIQFADLAKVITDEGIQALCFIPLVQHGRLLGKLTLYFDAKAPLPGSDLQLASTIASHVAFAIDRKLVEQQFVDLFEFAPDAIVMTDTRAVITRVNRRAESLFGYAPGELIGQTIDVLIPQDQPGADRLSMRGKFLASAMQPRPLGSTGRKDLRAISKSGRIFPVEISLAQMEGTQGKLIAAAVRDVSGRQQVMEQLISTAAELEHANVQIEEERAMLAQRVLERTDQLMLANKAKDSFLATMSHEIRTPLGGLLGMLELLGLSSLNRAQSEMLHVAQNSGKSLLRIVDDILDWSKIEAGKLELAPVVASIAETIKGVVGTYAQLASTKGITLRQKVDDTLSAAHLFDRLRVSQILNNFTSNAIKFTAHGSVEIGAEYAGRQNGSETVRFSVKDSGIGITPEQQARLFQHYEQASNDTARMYGGTGLGLAICRSLAELMEGTLSVQSTPGIGTTFFFTASFPVANLAAQRDLQLSLGQQERHEAEADVTPLVDQGQHLSVLVVDDHPVNRMLIAQQLVQLGLHVEAAESGIIGLSMWQSKHYDLVITDCHMPGMDGYEFTRSIREIEQLEGRQRVPVIAWTANVLAEEARRCQAAGMDDLLTKPTELSDLRVMLLTWLPKTAMTGNAVSSPAAVTIAAQDTVEEDAAIDFSVLRKFATSPALQHEMLREFNVHNRSDLANLKATLQDGDAAAIAQAAHRIKGACRMVGARELESICAGIEQAARQGNVPGAAVESLENAVGRVERAIARFTAA